MDTEQPTIVVGVVKCGGTEYPMMSVMDNEKINDQRIDSINFFL